MEQCYDVEFCDLEMKFERRHIQQFIQKLVENGYSIHWSENQQKLVVHIRTGKKLIKLRFVQSHHRYKMVGNYHIQDPVLSTIIEEMIERTLGHAVVKRFGDHQVTIENICFGERVRLVEIDGVDYRVIYEKKHIVSVEDMVKAFKSERAEKEIPIVRLELDYELALLYEALNHQDTSQILASKRKLEKLRKKMLQLEM